jgi:hypothetical protein
MHSVSRATHRTVALPSHPVWSRAQARVVALNVEAPQYLNHA